MDTGYSTRVLKKMVMMKYSLNSSNRLSSFYQKQKVLNDECVVFGCNVFYCWWRIVNIVSWNYINEREYVWMMLYKQLHLFLMFQMFDNICLRHRYLSIVLWLLSDSTISFDYIIYIFSFIVHLNHEWGENLGFINEWLAGI